MISKVITWGEDREQAIARMLRALDEYKIAGVRTTIPFCQFVLEHPSFLAGEFSTHFVDDEWNPEAISGATDGEALSAAVAAALVQRADGAGSTNNHPSSQEAASRADRSWSPWASNRRWKPRK